MDLREIRQLIKILDNTDVSEIEVSNEGQTVRITRALPGSGPQPQVTYVSAAPMGMPTMAPLPAAQAVAPTPTVAVPAPAPDDRPANALVITSPMVGTFYRSPSPDAAAFVEQGDVIKKGQVVCIVEAMKLMNEIEADVAGRVIKVLKDNATPVEFGDELFLIEPV